MVGSPLFRERYLSSRLILAVVLVLTGGVHGVEAGDPVPDVDVILEQEVPPRHAGARQQDGTPPSRDSKALCDPVLGTSCGWPGLRVRVGEAFEGDEIELVLADAWSTTHEWTGLQRAGAWWSSEMATRALYDSSGARPVTAEARGSGSVPGGSCLTISRTGR